MKPVSPANEHILIGFLQDILEITIESIDIQNPYNIRTFYEAEKENRLLYTEVDIIAKIQGGISIIIELQLQSKSHFPERILHYWSERFNVNYAKTEKKESKYKSLKPVFIICILDYIMFPDDQDLRRTYYVSDSDHQHVLSDKNDIPLMAMTFIELPKIKGNVPASLVDWMDCIVSGDVKLEAKSYVKEVIELVDRVDYIEEVKYMRDVIERAREDAKAELEFALEIGEERGEKRGEQIALAKTAHNLKKMGLSFEQINEATGLTVEEIKAL